MNNGRIESFARPYDMILDESSLLNEMLKSLDRFERERLIEIARNASNSSSLCTSSTLSPNTTTSSTSRNILDQTSSSPLTSDPDQDMSNEDQEKQNLLSKII